MAYVCKTIRSPVGSLKLVASNTGLSAVLWENDNPHRVSIGPLVDDPSHRILIEAEQQLADYFCARLRVFTLPLDLKGTAFQKSVGGPF